MIQNVSLGHLNGDVTQDVIFINPYWDDRWVDMRTP